ncbi:hypothetical protein EXIGLDRAFT_736721 [Exidia glandulosa HHB12029]|uniref:Histone deacetylase complex subunit SAP30 Sin3 binding domain-containing protein n=1 Tax=Exidia glandulosa HHB12029 TaxID=1314781 RepID=A0A165PCQ3_EXIGL|nr:hypothetical protein EXIGLDRAFT_736721 [Exidia glandulosa HHB12029]
MAPQPQRARPSARKRLDDSAFVGPSNLKRTAPDKPDGVDGRTKRKRVDQPNPNAVGNTSYAGGAATNGNSRRAATDEESVTVVDFTLLPTEALHKYIVKWDLLPLIWPLPYSTETPPLPGSLPGAPRASSPSAAVRKDPNRRRSTRLSEEVPGDPILADVLGVHDALAAICQRHWESQTAKETDALVQLFHTVRNNERIAAGGDYLRGDA